MSSTKEDTQELVCRVRGRVQMVMFRDFAQRHARALGLFGWVHNEEDGSVSLMAQGPRAKLEALVQKISRGPILARVDSISLGWEPSPRERHVSFVIRYD